jgi:acetylglutamate kinase
MENSKMLLDAFLSVYALRGKRFIFKIGGEAFKSPDQISRIVSEIISLRLSAVKTMIVYGAGPQMDEAIRAENRTINKKDGKRITEAADMLLLEKISREHGQMILKEFEKFPALLYPGMEEYLLDDKKMLLPAEPIGEGFGYTGQIIESKKNFWEDRKIQIIPPLGRAKDGSLLNVNADEIALAAGKIFKTETIVFITSAEGVIVEGNPVSSLSLAEIDILFGRKDVVSAGMFVKLKVAADAIKSGIKTCRIINSKKRILEMLLSNENTGTTVHS